MVLAMQQMAATVSCKRNRKQASKKARCRVRSRQPPQLCMQGRAALSNNAVKRAAVAATNLTVCATACSSALSLWRGTSTRPCTVTARALQGRHDGCMGVCRCNACCLGSTAGVQVLGDAAMGAGGGQPKKALGSRKRHWAGQYSGREPQHQQPPDQCTTPRMHQPHSPLDPLVVAGNGFCSCTASLTSSSTSCPKRHINQFPDAAKSPHRLIRLWWQAVTSAS